ncbi:hypothetical protein HNQ80_000186 [Anaerosolibacter carboniphilus]|uniref:Uncharacterized protein n=1 Tax=Anaerosolibacter carboniphilus TaxID=1417629 RepID=A0A841KKZ6_9FIRM|nr:hypothetical protein [Anaerosolibacter carboniphilus]MBB6214117.1 hypothetical protein [Anaerosolibacter carboniphilus]
MDEIENEYSSKATIRGNTYLFVAEDAIDVIKRCHELDRRILGIDSFIITEHATKSILEHCLDCSLQKNKDGCWTIAENFIRERMDLGMVFEIVYD